ncbi:proteasome ATPase [Sediminivirga luteola]|uniref:AAA ATPase forming ring-shaped complexes n=1 Tax=Sediminivirga luteola TaxID=1774748 RepID=A0A8J2XKD5_9MICO|nr:proteasome ATPase [Sediminivirga luteola]MCI2263924.1 proteasome ATPase [Sediminivirga luteola]GGA08730.1 proteasome-associated ATPase [Sediminivirga luteola]
MTSSETRAAEARQEIAQLRRQISEAAKRNETLSSTLRAAREELTRLRAEAERLAEPPNTWATLLKIIPAAEDDPEAVPYADILHGGRKMRVAVSASLPLGELVPGREVRLSEGLVVIGAGDFPGEGTVMVVKDVLPPDRVLVAGPTDEERVLLLSDRLRRQRLRPGDPVLADARSQFALEVVPKPDAKNLLLEVVPDISYADIGGLQPQISMIQDAVEMPFRHPELFREHGLKPPKGILLYGPPGCGKTLIAKAVANSLADRSAGHGAAGTGGSDGTPVTSYFLNIKGPELLDKYVGETERQLRSIFARAREKATEGNPVVVFFDEMDSLFRTRGTGVSSDVETTIVPQLLSEIDGVERLDNVIVIGASNREDMIDPAILRPGRLDVKIRIERPDRDAARDIFSKYLTAALPLHEAELRRHGSPEETAAALIDVAVDCIYAREERNAYLAVTYADGDQETLYFGDFASGAMIQNVVDRAKKHAIKDLLATGERGLREEHVRRACAEEFAEHEDLPNTSNPDEWARISGRKGERITHLRVIRHGEHAAGPADAPAGTATGTPGGVPVEDVRPAGGLL